MKVYIDYSDGHYSMRKAPQDADLPTAEISDEHFAAYRAFREQYRYWQERIGEMESSEDYQRQRLEGWARWHRERSGHGKA